MEKEKLIEKIMNLPKGRYVKIKYASDSIIANAENKGKKITKIVDAVVRLVKYENIKDVIPSGQTSENETIIVPHYLKMNNKTGNMLLLVAITKSPNHKPKVQYFIEGVESTYEDVVRIARPSSLSHSAPTNVYKIKAQNIISLGE